MHSIHRYAVILAFLVFISGTTRLYSGEKSLLLLTEKQGIMRSTNGGRHWVQFNKGLPESFIPVRLYAGKSSLFLGTYDSGLYRYELDGHKWVPMNSADFHIRSIYQQGARYRKITAFSSDPLNPEKIVIATKHSVYASQDTGRHWKILPEGGIGRLNYIISLSIRGGRVFAGTSFGGIYSLSRGHWKRHIRGLPYESYSSRKIFYEQIPSLAQHGNTIFAGIDFGKGLYTSTMNGQTWKQVSLPQQHKGFHRIYDIQCTEEGIYVAMGTNLLMKRYESPSWSVITLSQIVHTLPEEASPVGLLMLDDHMPPLFFSIEHKRKSDSPAASRKAIYASIPAVRRNLKGLVSTVKQCGFNALVIDMKDDWGNLYFPTRNRVAKEINSARRPLNIQGILRSLHENGIYAIARMVVFKDKRLYDAYNHKYAIINAETKEPWQEGDREYWVDPHARFIHDYTLDLARELQEIGFDEIQFDYIRFPSDGPIHLCRYTFREHRDAYKSEILSDFLYRAKTSLKIPISTDIYGFNSWYHFGNSIGQDMEAFSRIADVICPMVYPSHFGSRFYSWEPEVTRPYLIVHDGGVRAHKLLQHTAVIRPYLQAFNLLSPTWGPDYIKMQVDGAEKSGCSGFTFWNAKGYYGTVQRFFDQ